MTSKEKYRNLILTNKYYLEQFSKYVYIIYVASEEVGV